MQPGLPHPARATTGEVRGFVHVCCLGAYREVTWEIVHALLESRLYDRSAVIELGVLGSEADQQFVESLIRPFPRFRIAYRSTDLGEYEFPTLGLLQDACQTWDGPVYYLHTKGVSHSPYNQYPRYWRQLMLDHIVTNHELCLAELANADTVGANWAGQFYSGNFWWAQPSHIRRLPDIRALQRFPRMISRGDHRSRATETGRGMGPVWNTRLQCELWLHMIPGRAVYVGRRDYLELNRQLNWTISVADIVNELLAASGGRHFAELGTYAPSPYFDAVAAGTKVSIASRTQTDEGGEVDFLSTDPPGDGYDVIVVDLWDEPEHALDVMERCLPKLSGDGAVGVHHSNPPSGWHQRPPQEYTPGSEWTGQVWRAVVEFRFRHPQCEVFTVDTDWGCTVIRPSRRARHRPCAEPVGALGWTTFLDRRNELLNVVSVAWFRRSLYAEPYLNGSLRPSTRTELCNVVISAAGLDSCLQIGADSGETLGQIIAPIRHSVAPGSHADAFFASGLGLDRYDLIVVDAELDNDLTRLSDRGWIVADGANPSVVRFCSEHPELDVSAVGTCVVIHRRTGTAGAPTAIAGLRDLFCHRQLRHDAEDRQRSQLLEMEPYARNRDLLLAEVERNPDDVRSVLNLAHSYFDAGDFSNARSWYARRIEMREWWWSGLDDDVSVARFRLAESMAALGEQWPDVRDAPLTGASPAEDAVNPRFITVIGRGNSGTRAISSTLSRSGVFMGEPFKVDSCDLVPAEDMYEACRIIARYIPWRGGLEWDFGPVQTMPIPAEFTHLIERYLKSVLASPAPRRGWKLPETTLCYPWIKRLFPDIHYIFWVRNPRDCITNFHHTDDLRDFGIDYPPTDDPYLRRAISWKYQDDLVAATPAPRHWITVRLEDFVQHQERELTRLEEYLGLRLVRIPVRTDPVDRHKELPGLPFPEFLKPAMRKRGYPVADEGRQ